MLPRAILHGDSFLVLRIEGVPPQACARGGGAAIMLGQRVKLRKDGGIFALARSGPKQGGLVVVVMVYDADHG